MKAGSFFSQPYNTLILKAVGVVLIFSTLLDYVLLAIPLNISNNLWLADLIDEWVARGSVPLIGLAILFLGVGLDQRDEAIRLKGLPTLSFLIAALLGVLFLIMAPLYFNNSRITSAVQTRQINEQSKQAENQLNSLLAQQRERVTAIVSNQDQLAQLEAQLDNADLSAEQQAQLKQIKTTLDKVKSDPKALDQEVAKARTEGMKRIEEQQAEALAKLQPELRRERLHTTLSSLLYSVGYLGIAWMGLGGGVATARAAKPQMAKPQTAKPKAAKPKTVKLPRPKKRP
jgi:hypothetical protein